MNIKKLGFTVMELFVTISFIGILATMAVPNFFNMYERYIFRRDVFAVYDTILQARNNAISAKNCPFQDSAGDSFSKSWEIRFVRKPAADPNPAEYRAQMLCNLQGNSTITDPDRVVEEVVFNTKKGVIIDGFNEIEILQVFDDEDQISGSPDDFEVAEQSTALHFFTDSVRAKIHELEETVGTYEITQDNGIDIRYDNARIQFSHKSGLSEHTICMNRISAFPLRYERSADCQEI